MVIDQNFGVLLTPLPTTSMSFGQLPCWIFNTLCSGEIYLLKNRYLFFSFWVTTYAITECDFLCLLLFLCCLNFCSCLAWFKIFWIPVAWPCKHCNSWKLSLYITFLILFKFLIGVAIEHTTDFIDGECVPACLGCEVTLEYEYRGDG